MTTKWKVSYEFKTGIQVENPVLSYPTIGLTLQYNGNKLLRIEHELDADDAVEPTQVLTKSEGELALLWELVEYRWGPPLPPILKAVEKVQEGLSTTPVRTGFASISVRASICLPVVMPKPDQFPYNKTRIHVWLKLANDARKSDSAADAIRTYYMIWEDLNSDQNEKDWPQEGIELKLVRDFVSHGEELKNKDLLVFLDSKFKKHVNQFNPIDPIHRDFVNSYRLQARNLVERELNNQL